MARRSGVAVLANAVIDPLRSRLGFSPSPPPVSSIDVSKEKRPTRARRFRGAAAGNDGLQSFKDVVSEHRVASLIEKPVRVEAEQPPQNDQPIVHDEETHLVSRREPRKETHDQAVGQTQVLPSDSSIEEIAEEDNVANRAKGKADLGIQGSTAISKAKPAGKATGNPAAKTKEINTRKKAAADAKEKDIEKSAAPKEKILAPASKSSIAQPAKSDVSATREVKDRPIMRRTRATLAEAKKNTSDPAPSHKESIVAPKPKDLVSIKKPVVISEPIAAKSKASTVPWNVGEEVEAEVGAITKTLNARKAAVQTTTDASEKSTVQKAGEIAQKITTPLEGSKVVQPVIQATMETPIALLPSMPDELDFSVANDDTHYAVPSSPGHFAALRQQKRRLIDDDEDELEYIDEIQSSPHGKKQTELIGAQDQSTREGLGIDLTTRPDPPLKEKEAKAASSTAVMPMQSTPLKGTIEKEVRLQSSILAKSQSKPQKEGSIESDDEPIQLSARKRDQISSSIKGKAVTDASAKSSVRLKARPVVQKSLPAIQLSQRREEANVGLNQTALDPIGEPEVDTIDPFGFGLVEQSVKQRLLERSGLTQRNTQRIAAEIESQTQLEGQFSVRPNDTSTVTNTIQEMAERDESLPPLDFNISKKSEGAKEAAARPMISSQVLRKVEKDKSGNETSSDLSDFDTDGEIESWGGKSNKKAVAAKGKKTAPDSQLGPKTMEEIVQFSMMGAGGEEGVADAPTTQKGRSKGKVKASQSDRKLVMKDSVDSSFKIDKPAKGRALEVKSTPTLATAKSKKTTKQAASVANIRDEDDYDLPPGMTRPPAKKRRASASTTRKVASQKASKAASASTKAQVPSSSTSAKARPKARPLANRNDNQSRGASRGAEDDFDFYELPIAKQQPKASKKRATSTNTNGGDDEESQPVTKAGANRNKKTKISRQTDADDDEEN